MLQRSPRPQGKDRMVDDSLATLDAAVPLQALLGYLNLSTGKPDPRFQKQLSDAYGFFAQRGERNPHEAIRRALQARLTELGASGSSAFRDARQAETVLALVFDRILPAYRA